MLPLFVMAHAARVLKVPPLSQSDPALKRTSRLESAHEPGTGPGVGFFTAARHAGCHSNTWIVGMVPPTVNAERTKMSPVVCLFENAPVAGLQMTLCWKNQMPMLASPFVEKRSAPKIVTRSPFGALYAAA